MNHEPLLFQGFDDSRVGFSLQTTTGRQVDELSTALKDFEARRAECFCCCNGHRHPTTHETFGAKP